MLAVTPLQSSRAGHQHWERRVKLSSDLEVALHATAAGARIVRDLDRTPLARYDKSETDFATQADLDSEAAIREARPDDTFIGEERGGTAGRTNGRRPATPSTRALA